jgi:creatinine amidohydrolase
MTVQMELLRPEELDRIRDACPVAYIPVGSMEFHGYQNPVGLDTVKCHRMLMRIAEKVGGMVVPPVFYGHGSGHLGFPWTWMLDDAETLVKLLVTTALGLDGNGIKVIVVMSGHYPNEGAFADVEKEFRARGGKAALVPLMEYHAFDTAGEWHGDHAAKWETSYMMALGGDLVDANRLRVNPDGTTLDAVPRPTPPQPGGWWFEKNPSHPWYGIAAHDGNDPCEASAELGEQAIATIVTWAADLIHAALEKQG